MSIVKKGAMAGLRPSEIKQMQLWEYNAFVDSISEKQKCDVANAILIGYYTAYYMNGGKKAKNPNQLIKQLYKKSPPKQSLEDGFKAIKKLRESE